MRRDALSYSGVGRILGCSKSTAWYLVNNADNPVKLKYADKLATWLGIDPADLFVQKQHDALRRLTGAWRSSTSAKEYRSNATRLAAYVAEYLLQSGDVTISMTVQYTSDTGVFFAAWRLQANAEQCQAIMYLDTSSTAPLFIDLINGKSEVVSRNKLSYKYLDNIAHWAKNQITLK